MLLGPSVPAAAPPEGVGTLKMDTLRVGLHAAYVKIVGVTRQALTLGLQGPQSVPMVRKLQNPAPIVPKSPAERRSQCVRVLRRLKADYPDAECALIHKTPFQLLVATILSA